MVAFCALALAFSGVANAGYFEVSSGFSFNRTDYGSGNYNWTRHWGANLGYHFWDTSEIELSFADSFDRTMIANYEDTSFHDRTYSVNWVQAFAGRESILQPFVKAGIGQLNRDASGMYYAVGMQPPASLDSVTVIAGAGIKVRLNHSFSLRGDATTYLTGGAISTWRDNVSVTAGVSFYF